MRKILLLVFLLSIEQLVNGKAEVDGSSDFSKSVQHVRRRRYLGLSKRYKLNRRYQECVAPGDVQGHCKHIAFCPMDVLGSAKIALDYLCIIEKTHVGVCCPDDIALSGLTGSMLVMDLPAGGLDYEESETNTGCGLPILATRRSERAPVQRWPWIASLYTKSDKKHFCGGAIITERHILTAAHCTDGESAEGVAVRLGEYDYKEATETRYRDFNVVEIKQHEEFQLSTYANDIAVVTLDRPVAFNTYVWPICLPPTGRSFENKTAIVAGWGQKYFTGPTSDVLLQVEVPVWPQSKCVEAFLQRIEEENMCAAAYDGGKDSCLGDSGGPLLLQLENKRWVTIGIVSWGIGCGNKGEPGIYTRVNKFLPWIIKNTIAK